MVETRKARLQRMQQEVEGGATLSAPARPSTPTATTGARVAHRGKPTVAPRPAIADTSAGALREHRRGSVRATHRHARGSPADRPHPRDTFVNAKLSALYYNLSSRTAFTSLKKLSHEAGRQFGITESEVREWLLKQETYTRFRPARQKFPLNFYNIKGLDDVYEMDTNDLQRYAEFNDSYKYFLLMICCLSRYVWVFPLKSKEGAEVAGVLDKHFSAPRARVCRLLQADKGTELVGAEVMRVLHRHGISFRTLENRGKAAMAERANLTIKAPLWKYLNYASTWRWLEPLQKIVENYNHSIHSSIKMRPVDVTQKDVFRLWSTNYLRRVDPARWGSRQPDGGRRRHRQRLAIGDTVRVSLVKSKLEKGYTARWSQQIYKVVEITAFTPFPTYVLSDMNGARLKGNFYEQELLRVTPPADYRVEKILQRRQRRGRLPEVLVRWEGYDKEFDSWEPESSLRDL